jgi:hypothetical protein
MVSPTVRTQTTDLFSQSDFEQRSLLNEELTRLWEITLSEKIFNQLKMRLLIISDAKLATAELNSVSLDSNFVCIMEFKLNLSDSTINMTFQSKHFKSFQWI